MNDRDPRKRPETGGLRREGKRPAQNHFMIAIQLQQRVFSAHLHIFQCQQQQQHSACTRVCTCTHAHTQRCRKAQNLAAFGIVLGSHYNHGRICKVPVCRSPLSNDTVAAGVCVQERGRGVIVIFYFHGMQVAILAKVFSADSAVLPAHVDLSDVASGRGEKSVCFRTPAPAVDAFAGAVV